MATSSAVPVTLSRAAGALDHWADELGMWARRLAATPYPDASVSSASDRVGALVGRTTAHAGWTRDIALAFEAADRLRVKTAPGRLPNLATADLAARLALLPKLIWGKREPYSWLFGNQGGRYLRLDPRGDGRVVEVLGNLATAKHVVVLVPGMSNDIGNYRTSLRSKAVSLLAAMRSQTDDDVAVISWLGYDTPGLDGASGSTVAMVAAQTLIADVAAIRRSYPTAHVTVVGHSYGSVVLGRAMRAGIGVPTAIAVGSPGMDADDRDELGSHATTLWAAKSTTAISIRLLPFLHLPVPAIRIGDPVALAPVHGEDPSAKGFGARRFPVGDIGGHGEYFDPGTVSVRSIARIAVAQPPG